MASRPDRGWTPLQRLAQSPLQRARRGITNDQDGMNVLAEAKIWARRTPEEVGLGHHYFHGWWSVRGRSKPLITDWNRRHRAIFIHVPKTAGMSIAEMFQMERAGDYHAPACAFRAADPALFGAAFKFGVVRNPWDRLVSAFHYSLHASPFAEERAWAAKHLSQFKDFGEFVRALQSRRFRALVFQRLVFMPQSYFLCDPNGVIEVDQTVPFEDLARGLAAAANRIGVTLRPSRVNASHHDHYARYYTDETREIASRVYRNDIAAFGYEFGASCQVRVEAAE